MQSKLLQVPEPNSSLYSAPAEAKVPGFERVAVHRHVIVRAFAHQSDISHHTFHQ